MPDYAIKNFDDIDNAFAAFDITDLESLQLVREAKRLAKAQAKAQASQQALDAYQEVKKQAIEYHIPILNQNRFLYYVGYFESAKR